MNGEAPATSLYQHNHTNKCAMSKKLTDEELLAQFEDIPSADTATAASGKSASGAVDEDDPLAELSALAAARPVSRPETPRLSTSTTSGTKSKAEHTPQSSGPPSGRTSEDRSKTRKSTESARSYHQSQTINEQPQPHPQQQQEKRQEQVPQAGGGWGFGGWGASVFSAASAAVKQAEAAVKEVRGNPEVLKYAEQLRHNVNVESLKAYGGNVRNMALPTFTSLLETIAPPIAQHERLIIHTTHDLQAYPSLDPIIYEVFSRVMQQVEGGDLLVIQRGTESRQRGRSSSEAAYRGNILGTGSGAWTDGPWWREQSTQRSLGAVKGLTEGTKLCRANAEAYATDFFEARGGLEEVAKQATQTLSETNPVRSSDIFLAIQPLTQSAAKDLFAAAPKPDEPKSDVVDPDTDEETALFAIYLHDPIHSLSFSSLSQSFPAQWTQWLDASSPNPEDPEILPESIREIVESGGIDPREWVSEWLQDTLTLAIGVVAQRYVAKRMGVGEGGIGKGKQRQRAEETDAAGEAARAI
ncbi:hypothetical protein AUEXF2481DRAFT_38751 [Aureobasidium subglaciale EXF-2481]|uniref:Maintenance of telomere capping protein 1 n=1 Tax=Aureobasidium subglaciale (strain EXF-2481) TaxID=1043005 RepID=A0A074ZCT1_AURSE|nr:uncharacterized protein AUEXF2481DRAFT_38751 [Aureobasidium subglaciale EXF-2481]KAI5203252.1 hypothetical protein E4T38_05214 [Aureobasidium subglaciale]KAI5220361.1 hypothetical protein E4T40_05978 [Aureobasidium subglaciale]KAI5222922.1 hypothetical protein E4T41_06404 [Aureobasidium subglaciale]KAI5260174.1 hypothetical protein E4T46_06286 [Aureobasidium subglaciale]KEQ96486.1 hypothetical protein AUEXF2481DRAFT_38751 [Aureobasidium subglaciale EXF-2481]